MGPNKEICRFFLRNDNQLKGFNTEAVESRTQGVDFLVLKRTKRRSRNPKIPAGDFSVEYRFVVI